MEENDFTPDGKPPETENYLLSERNEDNKMYT